MECGAGDGEARNVEEGGRQVTTPRPLRILFFAVLAVAEFAYATRRGPTFGGVAEAIMGLLCAVIAWEQSVAWWSERKARRVARIVAEIQATAAEHAAAHGRAAPRKAGPR